MEIKLFTYLFLYFVISSGIRFFWVTLASIFPSKSIAQLNVQCITNYGSILDLLHLVAAYIFLKQEVNFVISDFIYEGFDFDVYWNLRALVFLSFSIVIISLINRFSTVYLYRDPFYFKFFSMIYLLQLALVMLILTRGSESIFIGWEFLGLSSVLLIAFYEYRISVLKNSLIILAIYKISDLLLYGSLLYATAGGDLYYNTMSNPYCIFALLLACLIKSSVFPWYWLPRAVEGPTQSTAVFYGGLATHIPVYIFMNVWEMQNLYNNYLFVMIAAIFILISVISTSMLSKMANDAKNSIAYATIAQLGIIYLEVLFGFTVLATIHCLLHGIYRTVEFLRSPSVLYEHQLIERGRRFSRKPPVILLSNFIPKQLKLWIYKIAYNEFTFSRIMMNGVENFMGLFSSRINALVVKSYVIYSLLLLISIELFTTLALDRKLLFIDAALLALAYALNVLALLNKYRPWTFFAALTTSVMVSLLILADKLYPVLVWSGFIAIMIMIYITVMTYRFRTQLQPTANFMGQMHQSSGLNFLLLIIGLSIIGMPGLGIFFIWTRLEHALIHFYPSLILVVYLLLTLNTIVFFRFYYVNFLGKHDILKQIKTMNS